MGIYSRARLSSAERGLVEAKYNSKGQMVDPNTGRALEQGKIDLGHKYGYEERAMQRCAKRSGLNQKDYSKMMRNPKLYQWEDRGENRKHSHECKNSREQIQKCMQVIREYKNKNNGKSLKSARERNATSRTVSQSKENHARVSSNNGTARGTRGSGHISGGGRSSGSSVGGISGSVSGGGRSSGAAVSGGKGK